ncbi:MAG TPA: hypothetical protein VFN02_07680 [Ktedonobacteraceae bacterium]|nr:hypothetical protein [Ktedonobacteraceae bacterium]
MDKSEEAKVWTLQHNNLTVRRGDLIEYEDANQQLLAAMVVAVNIVALSSSQHRAGDQVVAVKRVMNRRLPKASDLADHNIAATQVVRLYDPAQPIPLPAPAPKTLFAPNAEDNPWRTVTWMTSEEWKQVSRWYRFSLRSLLDEGDWYEHGRYASRDSAYTVMKALAGERPSRRLVIIHCTLQGKEGREQAVVSMPLGINALLQERQRRIEARR